eukprot:scaffold3107_cov126-Cylindrotheca_fusiformis.AAC.5
MVLILPPSGLAQETVFPSTSEQPSQSPSFLPTVDYCQETPSWRIYYVSPGSITGQYLFCHDNEVECNFKGAIGNKGYIPDAPASEHCCKCKQGCDGVCHDSPSQSPSFLSTVDCQDTPSWRTRHTSPESSASQFLFCNDTEVECNSKGAIGKNGYVPDAPAIDHCCKCKQGCDGFCSASPESSNDAALIGGMVAMIIVGLVCKLVELTKPHRQIL